MKRFLSLVLISISAISLSCSQKAENGSSNSGYENVTAQEFKTLMAKNDPNTVILDVRTPQEFNSGHIEGAVNIDFYERNFRSELAKLDSSKTYMIYCRTGRRSGVTANVMTKELGVPNVINMTGGIVTWNR